jgi:hypothetical protein
MYTVETETDGDAHTMLPPVLKLHDTRAFDKGP